MNQKEINSYEDLNKFIQHQLSLQITPTKKTAVIKINEKWFFKTVKLIQFTLKNDVGENDARRELNPKWKWFKVKCNGYKTTFVIYDL